ncbi:MAG: asparagine synthase (glutamine-hydrolyzing) [Candidatus Kaelpia aquatica]|nr:asparagine synthase (glutamine-hydrolyzing) [Candidatus Kaelpia aquatica]
MCGILGSLGCDIGDNGERFKRALSTLYSRGPDELGFSLAGEVKLGCRRLKIIGLEDGSQPICNEDGTLSIVFNGEIYNYRNLKAQLKSKGHLFKTDTDTEVILHLYEDRGIDCLGYLDGMFAFAIYDSRDKSLFIARDRFGIKPLFYFNSGDGFIFSSSIKAIVKLLGYRPDISNKALNLYFWLDYIPSPHTIYQSISSLLPAHYLTFSKSKGLKLKKYYTLSISDYSVKRKGDLVSDIKDKISESVKKHLVSDVEPGLLLSGGLDSSIVAYHMKDHIGAFNTFNIGFQDSSFDESKYAASVTGELGLKNNFKEFHLDSLFSYLENIVSELDQPFADHSLLPTYFLSEFTSKYLKVSLSGDGGDELFCGYQTYIAHRIFSIYKTVPLKLREGILRTMLLFTPASDRYFSLNFCLDRFSRSQSINDLIRHAAWMESFGKERKRLLSERHEDVENEYIDFIQDNFITKSEGLQRIQQFDIYSYLSNDILYKTDFASMRNSLEVRVPYLDRELVEFALSIPENLKLRNLKNTKYILRHAYGDMLPPEIIKKRKAGFSIPVASMLRFDLKDVLNDFIQNDSSLEYLNRSYIKSVLSEHLQYKKNNRKILWNILIFFIWSMKNEAE